MEEALKLPDNMEQKPRKWHSRYSLSLRVISALLVVTFFSQDLLHAQGGTPVWSQVQQAKAETPGGKTVESDRIKWRDFASDAGG